MPMHTLATANVLGVTVKVENMEVTPRCHSKPLRQRHSFNTTSGINDTQSIDNPTKQMEIESSKSVLRHPWGDFWSVYSPIDAQIDRPTNACSESGWYNAVHCRNTVSSSSAKPMGKPGGT